MRAVEVVTASSRGDEGRLLGVGFYVWLFVLFCECLAFEIASGCAGN